MARSICRRRSATPRPNISPAISRARCASTSTRSPTMPIRCRTCCRARSSSRATSARSASPRPTPSWSMTAPACSPRRGCGGRSGCSARRTCSCSKAGCRNGRPKAVRSRPAPVKRAPRTFRAGKPPDVVAVACRRAGGARRARPRRWSTRGPAERFRGEAPEPRPGVRPGHIPGSLSVPSTHLRRERHGCCRPISSRRRSRPAASTSTSR